jgi:hypothetical protein
LPAASRDAKSVTGCIWYGAGTPVNWLPITAPQ